MSAHFNVLREADLVDAHARRSLLVVDGGFGFAFGVFVDGFAFLAKEQPFFGGGPEAGNLLAFAVFLHFHAVRSHDQRAFERDGAARREQL